jgi:hypothetical protein
LTIVFVVWTMTGCSLVQKAVDRRKASVSTDRSFALEELIATVKNST